MKHADCKYFSSRAHCPNKDNEIMKKATQDIPQYYGGSPQLLSDLPDDNEIDAICSACDKFTPVQRSR